MPSNTLTVILNYNHSRQFAFVLRSSPETSHRNAILREARNKFRNKGLSHVFLRGGTILEEYIDIGDFTKQVWVGKGEPYSGPPSKPFQSNGAGEVRIIANKSFIDDNAIKQLQSVSELPGVRLAVGMPDLHPGSRFPIGCAIGSEGIYPALIGSDVGCGIALYHLSPSSKAVLNPTKLASSLRGLDYPWSGSVTKWLSAYGIDRSSPFDEAALGTIGAGNHFAEICTVEQIVDVQVAENLGIREGSLYLLVHTGSRGLGASILATETTNESNPYIPDDSPHLHAYLAQHGYAVKWAEANRDLVAHRIKQCIFNYPDADAAQPKDLEKIIDVTHNSVTKRVINLGDEVLDLWIHRKGAAPADQGFAPCPGSRGDFSWLLQPIGDGQYNAHSLAHGAGRRYGRNALHTGTKVHKSTLTTTSLGSEVVCTDPDLLIEERPEAYKDVGCVVDDMEEKDICKGVIVLRPCVTYKVREGGEGRNEKLGSS